MQEPIVSIVGSEAASPGGWKGRTGGLRSHRLAIGILLLGLAVTGALSWVTRTVNQHNEQRLLTTQTKETGTVLQVILPTLQTPLASAAEIAATTGGSSNLFTRYITPYVGPAPRGTFVSVSLWSVRSGTTPQMVADVGQIPVLATSPDKASTFLPQATHTSLLSVIGLFTGPRQRLGYAYASTSPGTRYVVYGESVVTPNRPAVVAKGSPFADLHFAIYLGRVARRNSLLSASPGALPLTGPHATDVVPFGSNALTLVATPNGPLGGTLSAWLWRIVAIVGSLLAIAATLTTERLIRRRTAAERLNAEVQQLLGQQRGIAETLQNALLPEDIPPIPGIEVAVRYIPGTTGVEIGGDWYDVLPLDDHRFFFVVGDVSGRGVRAGAVMASMHFAIRGFVSEGHSPATILDILSGMLRIRQHGHFATVLCGIADIDRHELTIANAGHLPPLLIDHDSGQFLSTQVGPPIGVTAHAPYGTATFSVPSHATLIAYTDGLVERRNEDLDSGLQRLHESATRADGASLEDVLTKVVNELTQDTADDDTAILGLRWLK